MCKLFTVRWGSSQLSSYRWNSENVMESSFYGLKHMLHYLATDSQADLGLIYMQPICRVVFHRCTQSLRTQNCITRDASFETIPALVLLAYWWRNQNAGIYLDLEFLLWQGRYELRLLKIVFFTFETAFFVGALISILCFLVIRG